MILTSFLKIRPASGDRKVRLLEPEGGDAVQAVMSIMPLDWRSVSILALKLGLIYFWAGLCHPEHSITSASVLKVPPVVYGCDNGVVMGPG